jgi:hypothetical protein
MNLPVSRLLKSCWLRLVSLQAANPWTWALAWTLLAASAACAWWWRQPSAPVALIIPAAAREHLLAQIWRSAAQEQGLAFEELSDDAWLRQRLLAKSRHRHVILPDGLAAHLSEAFEQELTHYVEEGGHVTLVYDPATRGAQGDWRLEGSGLTPLAGVTFGAYGQWKDATTTHSPILAGPDVALLQLPPGRLDDQGRLTAYGYTDASWPHLRVQAGCAAGCLLQSDLGEPLLTEARHGQGQVRWVNLPLGQLKAKTDGLLLHRVLQRIIEQEALPQLAMTPGGEGQLLVNVHVDAKTAVGPMRQLEAQGFFALGPMSLHFTAGPDVNRPGDGLGLALREPQALHEQIRRLRDAGHDIGSHGGWLHNIWGQEVGAEPMPEHQQWLAWNHEVMGSLRGRPVQSFSAPVGHHPPWVTRWLSQHQIQAYYTTAHVGSAPTRMWRQGVQDEDGIWAFPVSAHGGVATFEEALFAGGTAADELVRWLRSLNQWLAGQSEARLVYFHPPGAALLADAFQQWQDDLATHLARHDIQLTRMDQHARFLTQRAKVSWKAWQDQGAWRVDASHPDSLLGMTWRWPSARFDRPEVLSGQAQVRERAGHWLVEAGDGRGLSLRARSRMR